MRVPRQQELVVRVEDQHDHRLSSFAERCSVPSLGQGVVEKDHAGATATVERRTAGSACVRFGASGRPAPPRAFPAGPASRSLSTAPARRNAIGLAARKSCARTGAWILVERPAYPEVGDAGRRRGQGRTAYSASAGDNNTRPGWSSRVARSALRNRAPLQHPQRRVGPGLPPATSTRRPGGQLWPGRPRDRDSASRPSGPGSSSWSMSGAPSRRCLDDARAGYGRVSCHQSSAIAHAR